ncbi:response regulator [bacterium]|nr:response regulator [bacterium]
MSIFRKILLLTALSLSLVPPVAAAPVETHANNILFWCPLLVMALVTLFTMLWNHRLRQQVAERTAQLQPNQELQLAQSQAQGILDAIAESGIGLVVIDSDYKIRKMNPVMINWFGDQVDKLCYRALHGLEQPCSNCHKENVVQRGETVTYSHKESNGRTYEVVATPICNHDNSISDMEIFRDITSRIKTQHDLESNRLQLNLVMEAANLGYWDWRPLNDDLFTNDIFLTMLDYAPDAFPETTERWSTLVHPDDLDAAVKFLQPFLDGDDSLYRTEFRMRNADGQWCWVLDVGRVVERNPEGQAARLIGVHIDITEKKQAELELIESRQQANIANQAKSDFLANMSHEIRTPMNAIIGMSQLTLETDLKPDQKNYISKVHSSAEALLGIINGILDFSKIEAGKLDLEQVDFTLQSVIDDVQMLIVLRAEKKGLKLTADIAAEIPKTLKGDPLRLGQILINLTGNAVKFTTHGEVKISVNLIEAHEEGVTLHFCISDTGIGISEADQGKLFKSFSQVDSSTTRKFGGTGLGLSISKELIELMGGSTWLESEIGRGSRFSFSIPLTLGKAERVVTKPLEQFEDLGLHGAKILLVDDNELNLELAIALLDREGVLVTSARNGQEALDLMQTKSFDGILMDLQMPVMDGYMATREIRKLPQGKTLPIIAITANVRNEDREKAAAAGMNDHIGKPFRKHEMLRTMARWITPS